MDTIRSYEGCLIDLCGSVFITDDEVVDIFYLLELMELIDTNFKVRCLILIMSTENTVNIKHKIGIFEK